MRSASRSHEPPVGYLDGCANSLLRAPRFASKSSRPFAQGSRECESLGCLILDVVGLRSPTTACAKRTLLKRRGDTSLGVGISLQGCRDFPTRSATDYPLPHALVVRRSNSAVEAAEHSNRDLARRSASGPESVTRHSRGTRPLIAPCDKAPRHLHRAICARWVASAIGMPTRKTCAAMPSRVQRSIAGPRTTAFE